MKKLGKLKLKPEKMLKHDELVSFRGGSGSGGSCDGGYCSCQVFVDGDVWGGLCVPDAQQIYQTNHDAGRNAKYCCASCDSKSWAQCY